MADPLLSHVLETSHVFSRLNEADRALIARRLERRVLADGEALFRQGDSGQSLVIVAEGRLDVRFETRDGEVQICPLWPGDSVGEMACLDPAPRSATVVAVQPTIAFELHRNTLAALWKHAPRVGIALVGGINHLLTSRLRETDRRIANAMARMSILDSQIMGSSRPVSRPMGNRDEPSRFRGRLDARRLSTRSGLSPTELQSLARVALPKEWSAGQTLFEEGERGESCVIIAEGEVEVLKSGSRQPRVVATLHEGAIVGQIALLEKGERTASVRAQGRVVGLEVTSAIFERLLREGHPLGVRLLTLTAIAGVRQLRLATKRLAEIRAARDAEDKAHRNKRPRRKPTNPRLRASVKDKESVGEELDRALKKSALKAIDSLDVKVYVPEGQMSAAERKVRRIR